VAVLIKRRPPAETLTVEVLREVRGLTQKELADADVVELRPGQFYRTVVANALGSIVG